jgi:hypothetical protein
MFGYTTCVGCGDPVNPGVAVCDPCDIETGVELDRISAELEYEESLDRFTDVDFEPDYCMDLDDVDDGDMYGDFDTFSDFDDGEFW